MVGESGQPEATHLAPGHPWDQWQPGAEPRSLGSLLQPLGIKFSIVFKTAGLEWVCC